MPERAIILVASGGIVGSIAKRLQRRVCRVVQLRRKSGSGAVFIGGCQAAWWTWQGIAVQAMLRFPQRKSGSSKIYGSFRQA